MTPARFFSNPVPERSLSPVFVALRMWLLLWQGDSAKMARELSDALRIPRGACRRPAGSRGHRALRGDCGPHTISFAAAFSWPFSVISRSLRPNGRSRTPSLDAILGRCAETRTEVSVGLGLSRDNSTLERASRALALCGESVEVSSLSDELSRRFPDATLTNQILLPVTNAALAIHRGETRPCARSTRSR